MSGTSLLLDTNIVLYLLGGDKTLAAMLNDTEVYVSFITEMELLSYKNLRAGEESRIITGQHYCCLLPANEHTLAYSRRRFQEGKITGLPALRKIVFPHRISTIIYFTVLNKSCQRKVIVLIFIILKAKQKGRKSSGAGNHTGAIHSAAA